VSRELRKGCQYADRCSVRDFATYVWCFSSVCRHYQRSRVFSSGGAAFALVLYPVVLEILGGRRCYWKSVAAVIDLVDLLGGG
jgi:hypothetical protein